MIEATNYDEMSQSEAINQLVEDFSQSKVEVWQDTNYIIDATDVLYYADAYGDLEDAVKLQGFDKTLPTAAHKGLLDSGLDLFEAVNCHDMDTERCPSCDSEMWEFEIHEPGGNTSRHWVDEYGNLDRHNEFISDPAGHIWNAAREDDHAPLLCTPCSMHTGEDFRNGLIAVHYGETDEISAFSMAGNLVRWDFVSRVGFRTNADWTDLWGLPIDGQELATAFAKNQEHRSFEEVGWASIDKGDIEEQVEHHRSYKTRRVYKNVITEWAEGSETHPDLDFTYLIDTTSYRTPTVWVAEENRDELRDTLAELIEDNL